MKRRFRFCTLFALTLTLLSACAAVTPSADVQTPPPSPSGAAPAVTETQDSPEAAATPGETTGETPQGYPFEAYGHRLYVCMEYDPFRASFPEPDAVFESPSCAFTGVDITYFFPGFELTTYPGDKGEHILSIALIDDSVTTPEGVYIGGTLGDMQSAYGDSYTQSGDQYSYKIGEGSLSFNLADGVIANILYAYDIGLGN